MGEPLGGVEWVGPFLSRVCLYRPPPLARPKPAHSHGAWIWESWTQMWTRYVKTGFPEAGGLSCPHTSHPSHVHIYLHQADLALTAGCCSEAISSGLRSVAQPGKGFCMSTKSGWQHSGLRRGLARLVCPPCRSLGPQGCSGRWGGPTRLTWPQQGAG